MDNLRRLNGVRLSDESLRALDRNLRPIHMLFRTGHHAFDRGAVLGAVNALRFRADRAFRAA